MTTYDWHTTYRDAVETFAGSTPGAELEQELLDTFQHSPQTVTQAIAKAEHLHKQGKITSPWGIVRSELHRVSNQPHLHVVDSTNSERRIAEAEAWIRHTGLMLEQHEVIDHLFAPRLTTATVEQLKQIERATRQNVGRPLYEGLLFAAIRKTENEGPQPIANGGGPLTEHDTPALRQRITRLWTELQPTADQLRAEELERAEQWKHWNSARAAALAKAQDELAAAQVTANDDIPF